VKIGARIDRSAPEPLNAHVTLLRFAEW
jgi:hypothetical protein